jgi:hypothetical protein
MLEAQRRALSAMRTACEHDPVAHAHQRIALDREIGLAAEAADLESYLGASGSLFEVVRAERLDRACNHLRVGIAVGDRWHVEAAAADYRAALAATGFEDWALTLAGASDAESRGAEARTAFTRLMLVGLEQEWTPFPGRLAELAEMAESARATLAAADPALDGGAPEYRQRTPRPGPPADGPRLPRLDRRNWPPAPAGGPPVPVPESDPGATYAALAAVLAVDDPMRAPAEALARAGAELTAPEAQLRFVEEGLLTALAAAPLRARARAGIERLAVWPDPLVERHWRALLDAVDAAATPTEVELASLYASACFAVEADWNAVLHATLLGPLRAACAIGGSGEIGVDARAAWFLREVAAPMAAEPAGALGAFAGEAGFELVNDLRDALSGDARPLLARVRVRPSTPVTLWGQDVEALDPAAAERPFLAGGPRI